MAYRKGTQGMMQVDYEQRMDMNRMREYRVGRIKHYMDEFDIELNIDYQDDKVLSITPNVKAFDTESDMI